MHTLDRAQDPMGLAIKDYHARPDDTIAVTVYSDFSEPDEIPASLLFRSLDEMPELERLALQHCQGHTLDVGAGAGSHALALQQMDKQVTAMDISPLSVEVMKERGVRNTLLADVFTYEQRQYDTLLMLMNGIGLVGTLQGLENFLQHARKLLAPGGQLIFDSSDIIYLYEEEDGSYAIDLAADYYGQISYIMEYKEVKGERFDWLYVSFPVLEEYAAAAGFKAEMLYLGDHYDYLAKLTLV